MSGVTELRRMCRMFAASSALWLAGSGAAFAQSQAQPQLAGRNGGATAGGAYRIAGTIVDAMNGAPLGRARVSLTSVASRAPGLAVVTAEDGRFEFRGLPAGKFSLQGAKRGFVRTIYEQHGPLSTAIVTGTGVDTENLQLRLKPLAGLSGRVLDETGEGVRNAMVTIYRHGNREGLHQMEIADQVQTDDEGTYEMGTMDPDTYFLSVTAKPWYGVYPSTHQAGGDNFPSAVDPSLDVAYPVIFYDGATESDGATPILLKGGERRQIDVHLRPVPALHVMIHFAAGENSKAFNVPLLGRRVFGAIEYIQADPAYGDSEMVELTGISPGTYTMQSRPGLRSNGEGAREINLQSGAEVVDFSKAETSGGVKLTLKQASGESFPPGLLVGLRDSNMEFVAWQQLDSSATAAFPGLTQGKYSPYVGAGDGEYWVTRISAGGQEIAGRQITLTSGAELDLTVYFSRAVVSVEGFVKRDGKAVAGAMVVLVPKESEGQVDGFRRDQSDLDGSFIVRDVVPGTYSLIAIEDGWDVEWRKPGALSRYLGRGQELTVGPLMRGSVRLPDAVAAVR